ncbi:MAG: nuclear transport factor 2 family protein [Pseudolabrys sp.]
MIEPVSRAVVDAFYKAYAERDIEAVASFIDDNVEWTISGPVDVLTFAGKFRGKAAVLDLMQRLVPEVFNVFCFVPTMVLIEDDQVATLNRLWANRTVDGRVISYRLAHFLRFRGGKVVKNLSLIDSFDAVEQVLGHPLAVQAERTVAGHGVSP